VDAVARAASVVAELLDFYAEPALRRPPYLHGEAPMPDGPLVFRLALGRFASEGLDRIPESERDAAQVAAVAFVRQVCLWERADYYMVLCLEPGASPEELRECYHLLIALTHPDRHEAAWPAGAPQRANEAHAVLADPVRRSEYDRQLLKANEGVAHEARMAHAAPEGVASRPRRRERPAPALARFAVVSGVIAALFVVQAWWVGGVSPEHSLLERAIPASGRWIRSTLPDPPRFLGAFDPGERLQPLPQPPRLASLASWVPAPEERRQTEAPPVAAPSQQPSAAVPSVERSVPAPIGSSAATLPPARPAPSIVTNASAAPPPMRVAQSVPGPVAQRAAPTSPVPSRDSGNTPSRDQIEGLVALVVGFYDAGDAAQLVAMMDPDRHGLWARYQMRSTFSEFFDATSQRRLRMERLSWQPHGDLSQARGEAVVVAEYKDGRPRTERRVPVELDIKLHEGQPRIARLLLYPAGS